MAKRALGAAAVIMCACSSTVVVDNGYPTSSGPSDPNWPPPGTNGAPGAGSGFATADAGLPIVQTPSFGPTVSAQAAPIVGGTLLVSSDGRTAVAADPDRDRVFFADLSSGAKVGEVALAPGDEPGRIAEDGAGRVHVALRRGGAIVTIDLASKVVTARRDVCPAPRGIAFDAKAGALHVACATGELVTLPAAGGAPTRTVMLGRDLRDVVVTPSELLVSRFRSAEVLHVAADGAVTKTESVAAMEVPVGVGGLKGADTMTPSVAWRMIPRPGGGALMAHQRGRAATVGVHPGAYGGQTLCGSVVHSAVATIVAGDLAPAPAIDAAVLPVDLAVSPDGNTIALLAAGNAHTAPLPTVLSFSPGEYASGAPCERPHGAHPDGEPVAAAFTPDGRLVVQSRQPAALLVTRDPKTFASTTTIALASDTRADTGHAIFHSNAGAFVACASCHPEGGDDGRVWGFPFGPRRTPSLRGTLAGTEPYHWAGDEADIAQLSSEIFSGRMLGPSLDEAQVAALQRWLFAIPAPPAARVDAAAAARGQALFESSATACASCHAGAMRTNNATVDVGTGGAFQVPSLVGVAWRAPLLHDGCAETIADRFGKCASPKHGSTDALGAAQIADLTAFLESL